MIKFRSYDSRIFVTTGDILFAQRFDGTWRICRYYNRLAMPTVADMPTNWFVA